MNSHFNAVILITLSFLITACTENSATDNPSNPEPEIKDIRAFKAAPTSLDLGYNVLTDIPVTNENGSVNVVIEIPTGSVDKWEVNKSDGTLIWQEENGTLRKVNYLGYPGNYGMIPQTYLPKELGGDGDPLDVIVLGDAVGRGAILESKIIGVLELLDRGEQDDKLIAVTAGTPFYEIDDIAELEETYNGVLEIVTTWFKNYKGPGKMELKSVAGKDRAEEILEASIKAYKEAN